MSASSLDFQASLNAEFLLCVDSTRHCDGALKRNIQDLAQEDDTCTNTTRSRKKSSRRMRSRLHRPMVVIGKRTRDAAQAQSTVRVAEQKQVKREPEVKVFDKLLGKTLTAAVVCLQCDADGRIWCLDDEGEFHVVTADGECMGLIHEMSSKAIQFALDKEARELFFIEHEHDDDDNMHVDGADNPSTLRVVRCRFQVSDSGIIYLSRSLAPALPHPNLSGSVRGMTVDLAHQVLYLAFESTLVSITIPPRLGTTAGDRRESKNSLEKTNTIQQRLHSTSTGLPWPRETQTLPHSPLAKYVFSSVAYSPYHRALFLTDHANSCLYRVPIVAPHVLGTPRIVLGRPAPQPQSARGMVSVARVKQPGGLSIDPIDGTVYMTDSADHRLLRLDGALCALESIAGNGNSHAPESSARLRDQVSLPRPSHSLVTPDRRVWVMVHPKGEDSVMIFFPSLHTYAAQWIERTLHSVSSWPELKSIPDALLRTWIEYAAPGSADHVSPELKREWRESWQKMKPPSAKSLSSSLSKRH